MTALIGWLKGKKTYFLGVGSVLWGLFTWLVLEDETTGWQRILDGLSLLTLRAGVAKAAIFKPQDVGGSKK